jgi:TniQ
MPMPPPLGRSLIPLPGESLPGFILRLSYRLQLPPARLAALTGLVLAGHSSARAPASLLTEIPEPARRTFAHMTRLTTEKVAHLGLACLQERYPLPTRSAKNAVTARLLLTDRSIFAPATRYCPDCLTGDRSPVQDAFGGPWRKTWHLPAVFACALHQRLLEDHCPECDQPVHGRHPGTPSLLLPAMRAKPLHPSQCRAVLNPGRGSTLPTCCGNRLDHTLNHRQAGPQLIALQYKIFDLLAPDGPARTLSAGEQTDPARYFTDLQALALLICSTWPAARNLSPSQDTAEAIDQHVESLRKQAADRQSHTLSAKARVMFDPPPTDAAASAGLTHIADRILLSGRPDQVREHLRTLLPTSTRQASRTSWGLRVSRSTTPCSPGLRAAYAPLLKAFTKAGGRPQARREATIRPQRWGPEHIPAFLPKDWHDRHFKPLTGINPMFTRRTAVLRLVQMVTGGSLGEAAQFLGIATTRTTWQGRIYSGAGHVHSNAKKQPDPLSFEAALNALTAELDEPTTPLIDFQRRRQVLETWAIDEDTWKNLVARLPPVPGPRHPELGDRKRQIASIYIWVEVTSGEHHFAPRPIEAAQPPAIQQAWALRRNTIWHLLQRDRPRPHYTSLKTELNTLAASLARTIDAQPPTTPGNRHL